MIRPSNKVAPIRAAEDEHPTQSEPAPASLRPHRQHLPPIDSSLIHRPASLNASALSIHNERELHQHEQLKRESRLFLGDLVPGQQTVQSVPAPNLPDQLLLRSLETNEGTLQPAFHPLKHIYVLTVGPSTTTIKVYATAFNGEVTLDHGSIHTAVPFPPDQQRRKLLVKVSDQDEDDETNYLIDVRRTLHADEIARERRLVLPAAHTFVAKGCFEPLDETQLELVPGMVLKVDSTSDDGWYHGCVVRDPNAAASASVGQQGWFPQNLAVSVDASSHSQNQSQTESGRLSHVDQMTTQSVSSKHHKSLLLEAGEMEQPQLLGLPVEPAFKIANEGYHSYVSVLLMFGMIVWFIASLGVEGRVAPLRVNPLVGVTDGTLSRVGACVPHGIQDGYAHTLLSSMFIPVGLLSGLTYLGFLYLMLVPFEMANSSMATFFVSVSAHMFGCLLSCLVLPTWTVAGPGALLWGVLGGDLVILHLARAPIKDNLPSIAVLLVFAALSTTFGLFPGENNWFHAGGFFAGAAVSFVFFYDKQFPSKYNAEQMQAARRSRFLVSFWTIILLFVAFCVMLVILLLRNEESKPCDWCRKSSCIPRFGWCDATRLKIE